MDTQPNKPLSLAVLRTRNGEIPGFEDFYLLTCMNTLSDIRGSVSDETEVWNILRAVYAEVWRRRANMPEAGIIRPWIRVLIRDVARRKFQTVIGEFPQDPDQETLRVADEKAETVLIEIEEELRLLRLPDAISGRRRSSSMLLSVIRFLFSLALVAAAVCTAVFLLRRASGDEGGAAEPMETVAEASGEIQVEDAAEETDAPVYVNGWNDTRDGRCYRLDDGSWAEDTWIEEADKLYYLDENGYTVSGSRQFGNQNFVFDTDGSVSDISRSYGFEQKETVLSLQMKNYGSEDDAAYIIENSITLDGDWIYYLWAGDDATGLPMLLRVKRNEEDTELISDRVSGYTVQQQFVWYSSGGKVLPFPKETEGAAVGSGVTVQAEDDGWYLKDNFGRNVTGTGGYETIEGRVYRLDDGLIRSVTPGTQKIDSYTFRISNGSIMLGDGREYVRHGEGITALATKGESLYYSVVTDNGKDPESQLWRLDVYTGEASPVTGSFPGKVTVMYPWPEADCIIFEYRPGSSGSLYGKIGVIDSGAGYVLDDSSARKGDFGNGNDLLQPVWTDSGNLDCYWHNCSGVSSDGTLNISDSRTLELSLSGRSRLGSGEGVSGPSFFGTNWKNAEIDSPPDAEDIEEDEEEEEAKETVPAVPDEDDEIEDGNVLSEDEMVEKSAAATVTAPEVPEEETERASAAAAVPTKAEPAPSAPGTGSGTSPTYAAPTDISATVEAMPGPTVSPKPAETIGARPGDPVSGTSETVSPVPGR